MADTGTREQEETPLHCVSERIQKKGENFRSPLKSLHSWCVCNGDSV